MVYKSNLVYEGEWTEDLREGEGYEQFPNGNIYTGSFSLGKPK
jgi:hypothetical protein